MEKETRSAIERATQRARLILEADFAEQLQGDYDVLADGRVGEQPGVHLTGRQKVLHVRIVAAVQHKRMSGMKPAEAVADYLRDAAFTTLNRFVALKMLEARGLVQECITKGDASSGFVNEYLAFAPGAKFADGRGYRLYIESIFDELSTEVKVLFDRRDPASALWPRRSTFSELLDILNAPALAGVWGEDETIGWVYQYFNGQDERRAMREASQAPSNSRELAVRNQFFTPRYVVQFLTDNTLGRIWYEMRDGDTALADQCEYMVRQPDDTWLPRAKKDPRDLRVLDPACGSGHFLLYAFDLLVTIYQEAWADPASPLSEATGATLRADYPDLDALKLSLPGLILAHNLHGVDIDPRCAQIAQLALWMRAQRAFREFAVDRATRPLIRRSNIVIAEPMPGEQDLRDEFLRELGEDRLEGLMRRALDISEGLPVRTTKAMADSLAALLETVWDEMALAGEMGVLLKIERTLAGAIKKARRDWEADMPLFRAAAYDLDFWGKAERLVLRALEDYADAAGGAGVANRRLFADDVAHGFALADLVSKTFDVVLMNPPFGETTKATKAAVREKYPVSFNDILAAFVERGLEMLRVDGRLGAITSRAGFFSSSMRGWREKVVESRIDIMADLGEGVMDAAMVEAAAYCLSKSPSPKVFRVLCEKDKGPSLLRDVTAVNLGRSSSKVYYPDFDAISSLDGRPFAYWVSSTALKRMAAIPTFEPNRGAVRKGLRTGDNFRYVRAMWEVKTSSICTTGENPESAAGWVPLIMTGASQPWFAPIYLLVNWKSGGRELRAFVLKYGTESRLIQAKDFYFKSGFSWTRRAPRMYPYWVPQGCIFTGSRPMGFPQSEGESPSIVGFFASRFASAFLRLHGEKFLYPNFLEGKVKLLPIPHMESSLGETLSEAVAHGYAGAKQVYSQFEPFNEFISPNFDLYPKMPNGIRFDANQLLNDEAEEQVGAAVGLTQGELSEFTRDLDEALELTQAGSPGENDGEEDSEASILVDTPRERALRIISYAVGCKFGRWDIRMASSEKSATPLREFDLRVRGSPVGILIENDAPASEGLSQYPISIVRSGILADDPGHENDINRHVDQVFDVLGLDKSEVFDLAFGGISDRSSNWVEFDGWHRNVYTLGRRKAPIYWQLATSSARYSLWLYIHTFGKDTLFRVQNDYVAPKLAHERRQLEGLRAEAGGSPTTAQSRAIEAQTTFVAELSALLDEVKRVAPLWDPDRDDGVILNFAPLWRLVPQNRVWQKELRAAWASLVAGDYDWARLSMRLWPERVVPNCAKDRSLAIAHDLEDVFWFEDAAGKWKPRATPLRSVDDLIAERTIPAVKTALKTLLEAPEPVGTTKRGRNAKAN